MARHLNAVDSESSLPAKPALGKGARWTRAKKARIRGRFVLIGWADMPACWGLVAGDPEEATVLIKLPNGGTDLAFIDSPEQVIRIGAAVTFPR